MQTFDDFPKQNFAVRTATMKFGAVDGLNRCEVEENVHARTSAMEFLWQR